MQEKQAPDDVELMQVEAGSSGARGLLELLESLALGVLGGLVGAVMATLVVRFLLTAPTGTQNFNTFAEILFNFQLSAWLLVAGMIFSVAIGLFGGFFPAARAARLKIINALREA